MAKMVLGVFNDRNHAAQAVTDLENNGYSTKDISVVVKEGVVKADDVNNPSSRTAQGTLSGAATGGIIGALTGLLAGIGAIAIPGLGAVLIGGPIAAALGLTGAAATTVSGAVTGALAGGIAGALINMGIPEPQAKVYEQELQRGGILIAVPIANDQEATVRDILDNHSAHQIETVDTK